MLLFHSSHRHQVATDLAAALEESMFEAVVQQSMQDDTKLQQKQKEDEEVTPVYVIYLS